MEQKTNKEIHRYCLYGFASLLFIIFLLALALCARAQCGLPLGTIPQNTEPDTCYNISSADTIDVCFTFTAPGSTLVFISIPQGSCGSSLNISAALYDSSCTLVTPFAYGAVNVIQGNQYTWCLHFVCTGTHDTIFCPEYFDFSNPLPVTWLNIYADYFPLQDYSMLKWSTASETNSSYFEPEHSMSGNYFLPLARMHGAGTSNQIHNYAFKHFKPASGLNMYRIKQVDYNGMVSYSNTVSIYKPAAIKEFYSVFDITGRLVGILREDELDNLALGWYILMGNNNSRKKFKR